VIQLLAGAAVLHAPQVAQLQLELVDGQMRNLQRGVAPRERALVSVSILDLLHIRGHGA
jgi:hypothetical protein